MTRTIKALGLGLVAVLALGALGAPAASAQNGELYAEGEVNKFTLTGAETGSGMNRYTAFGARMECPESTATGHAVLTHSETTESKEHQLLQDGASAVTVTPHVASCRATALAFPATLEMNGCDYTVHIGETKEEEADLYGGLATLECPGEEGPRFTIFKIGAAHTEANLKCTLTTVPNPEGYSGLYATDTTDGTISINGSAEGFTVTQHEGPAKGCLSAETTDSNAKIDADVTITAHDENGEQVGVGLSHE